MSYTYTYKAKLPTKTIDSKPLSGVIKKNGYWGYWYQHEFISCATKEQAQKQQHSTVNYMKVKQLV